MISGALLPTLLFNESNKNTRLPKATTAAPIPVATNANRNAFKATEDVFTTAEYAACDILSIANLPALCPERNAETS